MIELLLLIGWALVCKETEPVAIDVGVTEEMYKQLQKEELAYMAKLAQTAKETDFSKPDSVDFYHALAQGQKND